MSVRKLTQNPTRAQAKSDTLARHIDPRALIKLPVRASSQP